MATIENDGLVKVTGVDGNEGNGGTTPTLSANPAAITNYGRVALILNAGTISVTCNPTAMNGISMRWDRAQNQCKPHHGDEVRPSWT